MTGQERFHYILKGIRLTCSALILILAVYGVGARVYHHYWPSLETSGVAK